MLRPMSPAPPQCSVDGVDLKMESGLPACVQVSVGNESQQVQVQQPYQQQVMVPVSQSVQGPMPVYYSVITPTQQTSTRYTTTLLTR